MTTCLDPHQRLVGTDLLHSQGDASVTDLDALTDFEVLEQGRVVDVQDRRAAPGVAHAHAERSPHPQVDATVRKLPEAHLRPWQVGQDRNGASDPLGRLTNPRQSIDVLLERSVAEVEAHHVETGIDQIAQLCDVVAGGPDGRHDLRSACHLCLSVPRWSCC